MERGKRITLTPARKMVLELMHHAKQVPSLPLARQINVAALTEPRRRAGISWAAMFLKAYSLVARELPELRRAYIPYLLQHYYEHPESIAAVLVEREYAGDNVVFGSRLRGPEERSLVNIDDALRGLREKPVEQVKSFLQLLRVGSMPGFVRRFLFWSSLYLSGRWRAKQYGTFMISSLGNLGVEQFHPLTFHTTYVTYGPIDPSGTVTVKIIYDHRVMDGRTVARALGALEQVLNGPILAEVQSLVAASSVARAA